MLKLIYNLSEKKVSLFGFDVTNEYFTNVEYVEPKDNFYEVGVYFGDDRKPTPVLRTPILSTIVIVKE